MKAYLFNGYWEDIGTMKSFFDANLALAQDPPKFEFFDPEGPIVTSPRFLPPARINNCKVEESIISHGAAISNSTVTSAIVGVRSRVRLGSPPLPRLHGLRNRLAAELDVRLNALKPTPGQAAPIRAAPTGACDIPGAGGWNVQCAATRAQCLCMMPMHE